MKGNRRTRTFIIICVTVFLIALITIAGSVMDPESYAANKGFQTLQALYAIGSGGLFGKGLGNSAQKLGALPEAQKRVSGDISRAFFA